jgi:hypothetical protein
MRIKNIFGKGARQHLHTDCIYMEKETGKYYFLVNDMSLHMFRLVDMESGTIMDVAFPNFESIMKSYNLTELDAVLDIE